jgi:hypothetical protein
MGQLHASAFRYRDCNLPRLRAGALIGDDFGFGPVKIPVPAPDFLFCGAGID